MTDSPTTADERALLYIALKGQGMTYAQVAESAGGGSTGASVRNVIRRYNEKTLGRYTGYAGTFSAPLVDSPKVVFATEDYSPEELIDGPQDDLEIWTIDIERFPRVEYSWSAKKYSKFTPEYLLVEEGRMVSFAAKKLGGPAIFSSEFHHGRKQMLDTLWHVLNRATVVVGWNTKRFDIPHIDGELRDDGYPPYVPFKQIDLFQAIKTRFKYEYNTMKSVAKRWGLDEEKMENDGFDLWKRCMAEDEDAWDQMRRYNIQDVKTAEAAYLANRAWLPGSIPNLALWSNGLACPACASDEVEEDGVTPTGVSLYTAYRCKKCGYRSRSNEKVASTTLRPIPR